MNAPSIVPVSAKAMVRSVLAALLLCSAPVLLTAAAVHDKAAVPPVISNGQRVALTDYLVTGKTTVFDFYSDYCPTCRAIAPGIQKLHATRPDIAVVLVNINRPGIKAIDWQSPVVKQYHLPSTPQLKVFGPDGKLVAEGPSAYRMVTAWLE